MAISIPIVTEFVGTGIAKARKEFAQLETNGKKAQFAISKAALPAAAALTAVAAAAMGAAKAAMADQQAQVMLASQISRTTGATKQQTDANELFIASLSKTVAVADDELRPALASLVNGTKSLQTAQGLLRVALDTSAATGLNLGAVSDALSRGFNGNMRALAKLSPELKTAIAEGATFSDVLKILETNFGGAAKASADTAAGGMKKFQIALDEAQEAIGEALIPYMEDLIPLLVAGADWFSRNSKAIVIAAAALGSIATVLLVAKGALVAYNIIAAITTAANTALATSGFAVQISTGVGIASAIAGAAALAGIAIMIGKATKANYDYAKSNTTAAAETGFLKVQIDRAKAAADAKRLADAAATAATEKAAAAAQKAAQASKALFKATKDALKDAKQSLRDYAKTLADTVRGYVSLSNAVQTADDREKSYTEALAERTAAYAELNKLQASGVATTEQLADAAERVAKAEQAVNTAQSQRTSYGQQFREQIAAAKTFGQQLQTLIGQGLSKAALMQLMNLGPVAGSQVAGELITGVGGMTAASISADLAGLDVAAGLLGESAISQDMGALNQAAVGKTGNNVYVTVTSADPNAVVDALRKYMKQNGAVPIKVTNKS